MDSYEILKNIHKVGHPMAAVVVGHETIERNGFYCCTVEVKADTAFKAVVNLFGRAEEFREELIPKRGSVIETVVENHVEETLYLSVDPDDLQKINEYKAFYEFIETLREGTVVSGLVEATVGFGVLVDLSCPYPGLIDVGHTHFNGGERLPYNFADKLKKGDAIKCIVSYFRFHNRQIGLGWLPDNK